jgi:hypothetical protein
VALKTGLFLRGSLLLWFVNITGLSMVLRSLTSSRRQCYEHIRDVRVTHTCNKIMQPAKKAMLWNISLSAFRPINVTKSSDFCNQVLSLNGNDVNTVINMRFINTKQILTFQNQGITPKNKIAESLTIVTNSQAKWKRLR